MHSPEPTATIALSPTPNRDIPCSQRIPADGLLDVVTLTYEQLLTDAVGTLERVLPAHTGEPFDRERAAAIVDKFSFKRQTGRRAGTEDRKSFLRKGVAGDWVNHFDRSAGERFDQLAGDLLVELGYADDRRWYHDLPD